MLNALKKITPSRYLFITYKLNVMAHKPEGQVKFSGGSPLEFENCIYHEFHRDIMDYLEDHQSYSMTVERAEELDSHAQLHYHYLIRSRKNIRIADLRKVIHSMKRETSQYRKIQVFISRITTIDHLDALALYMKKMRNAPILELYSKIRGCVEGLVPDSECSGSYIQVHRKANGELAPFDFVYYYFDSWFSD